jgi:integrase
MYSCPVSDSSQSERGLTLALPFLGSKGLYLAQRALGHRQITTTEIYARVDDHAVRRAVASN